MKNILFHSGEFWFNEKGFPQLLDFGVWENQSDKTEYFNALQLALADSVKFKDQDAILFKVRDMLFKTSNGMDGRNGWQPVEGQTFFIGGVTTKFIYENNKTFGGRGTTQVAVLSNSPVKSETPKKKDEDAVYLKGFYTKTNLQSFVDGFKPKAKPTVEGEKSIEEKIKLFEEFASPLIRYRFQAAISELYTHVADNYDQIMPEFIGFIGKKLDEIYPIKDSFFDPSGIEVKEHNKILRKAMMWAFVLGARASKLK